MSIDTLNLIVYKYFKFMLIIIYNSISTLVPILRLYLNVYLRLVFQFVSCPSQC